ncbi:alkene reductase [Actinomadura hibisca]|uniref:alkene reductase n=1 Tax=Actinomadura hibisca TaxID=68565 RepID=UPI0008327DE1|nr:alkene reductase [Actinomadura hibisca]
MSTLFTPAALGPLTLPNRLVMAPMTRNRATAEGVPTPLMAEYYAQRATAGLIVAEAATPNRVGQTYPDIPGAYAQAQTEGWRHVTDAVRAAGGRMFLQLQHGGRIGHPANSGLDPVAPSPVPFPDVIHTPDGPQPAPVPREMTLDDISATVADFAQAARNAVAAGFSGVEIHAANGYLLHQFLSTHTNHRADAYGGSIENRIRFVLEVVDAVVAAVGAERVGIRLAPGVTANAMQESDVEALYPVLTRELSTRRLAYLHIVFADPDAPLFHELRRLWPTVLVANPALPWPSPFPADGGRAEGERLLAAGADLVSLGRAFLANPDLVERLQQGAPLNEPRPEHWYGGTEQGYTDYPVLVPVPA